MANIFITGCNRGLGLEFTRQYLKQNHKVIATCRDIEDVKELRELSTIGDLEIHELDVSKHEMINQLQKKLSGQAIDILINNAGIWRGSHLGSISADDWLDSFLVNAISPIKIIEQFLPNLELGDQKKVVSITSKMGSIEDNTSGGSYIYRSSKSALNSAMQSMRHDLINKNIATLTLHPGWVRTDMGGPGGWINVEESVNGMIEVINQLSIKNSGKYIDYAGKHIPW